MPIASGLRRFFLCLRNPVPAQPRAVANIVAPMANPAPPVPAAVRIVCGVRLLAVQPPTSISSAATLALREAVTASYGAQYAGSLAVFPVFGTKEVVIGHACSRAPQHFATPNSVSNDSPLLTTHRISAGGFGFGPCVDESSGVTVVDVLDGIIETAARDPRWQAMGVTAQGEGARHYLLTDDGAAGDLVWGVVHWRAGDSYARGRVETWTRDTAPGEQARLVGVSFGKVSAALPIVAIEKALPSQWNGPECQAAASETVDVMFTEKPFGWWLVV